MEVGIVCHSAPDPMVGDKAILYIFKILYDVNKTIYIVQHRGQYTEWFDNVVKLRTIIYVILLVLTLLFRMSDVCVTNNKSTCPFSSDCESAELCSPVKSSTFIPKKKEESEPQTPHDRSGPHVSPGHPDNLSVRLGDFTQQPQILRESSIRNSSKISVPKKDCPLCGKVRHPCMCLTEQQPLRPFRQPSVTLSWC